MNELVNYGKETMIVAVRNGDFSRIKGLVADFNSKNAQIKAAGHAALLGAATVVADMLEEGIKAGWKIGESRPTRAAIAYAFSKGPAEIQQMLQWCVNYAGEIVRQGAGKSVSVRTAPPAESVDPVQRVEIIGMPARRTDTEIERNSVGDIVSSAQIEQDA